MNREWTHLRDVYAFVQTTLPLDSEDGEPQAPGSNVPRWKRNVRAVFQYRKRTGEVEWNGKSEYRLSRSGIPREAVIPEPPALASPDEVQLGQPLFEGAVSRILVNAFERNDVARRRCIEAYGASCFICGFDFGVSYGPVADGYIHVHHLRPLSELKEQYVVDPIRDLRPVCPNCHAVLHLGGRCRSIEEMGRLLGERRRPRVER